MSVDEQVLDGMEHGGEVFDPYDTGFSLQRVDPPLDPIDGGRGSRFEGQRIALELVEGVLSGMEELLVGGLVDPRRDRELLLGGPRRGGVGVQGPSNLGQGGKGLFEVGRGVCALSRREGGEASQDRLERDLGVGLGEGAEAVYKGTHGFGMRGIDGRQCGPQLVEKQV